MKKRLLAGMAALVMCMALLPAGAMASAPDTGTENTENWIDVADTNWYSEDATVYHLSTAEQLAGLAYLVNKGNTFAGKTIYLDNDVDLAGREWTSIGTGNHVSYYFGGVFDGQENSVYHLTSKESSTFQDHGLFGTISNNGIVRNLSVIDADLYSYDDYLRMGILADWINTGVVKNCYTSGTVHNASGNKLLGGIVGTGTAGSKIIGCGSDAKIISDYYDDAYSDCDTVGGIVGQWENSTEDSLISDCWFGGSISCGFYDSGVGGILGANFDFDGQPGVTIQNCMVVTKEIRCVEPGNITWIGAVVDSLVENCLWPDSPPEDVTLDPEIYEGYNGTYLAVVKLVVDVSQGTASADPNFDQSTCGRAVSDFNSDEILAALNENASEDVTWVQGAEHPVFDWDTENAYVSVTGVSLDSEELSLTVGGTAALNATVSPDNATNKTVTWSTSNPSVATVDANGLVTAVAPGEATITATAGGVSAACEVTVNPYIPPVPSYLIQLPEVEGGTVTADLAAARQGTEVALTVTPDEGFALASLTVTDFFGNQVDISRNSDGTYSFVMPASQVTVSAVFAPAQLPFTDVTEANWYYDEVYYVWANGLMQGTSATTFGPNVDTTRAMVVTILWRLEGEPASGYDMDYSDVAGGAWYAGAVRWATEHGIVNGSEGQFYPGGTVTREQLAAMLYRYAQYKGYDLTAGGDLSGFADAGAVSGWAETSLEWAVSQSLIQGSANQIDPTGSAIRAQLAAILMRFCENLAA